MEITSEKKPYKVTINFDNNSHTFIRKSSKKECCAYLLGVIRYCIDKDLKVVSCDIKNVMKNEL